MSHNKEEKDLLSRRKFLVTAGTLATGLLATGLAGCASNTAGNNENGQSVAAPVVKEGEAAPLPWPYKKLDIDVVRKRGFEGYHKYGCCYGAAEALILTLRETVGGPWNQLPIDMFKWGAGGGLSWGTLCGALNSSLHVINLATDKFSDVGNELMGWYTLFPFPSDKHESYCEFKKQVTTVANSPLCHVSVSTWAAKAGARVNEKEKKDRCAKVTGDTAAKAAELLNLALEGTIVKDYKVPQDFSHCMACHQSANSLRDDEQGKFNCILCHEDHTKKL